MTVVGNKESEREKKGSRLERVRPVNLKIFIVTFSTLICTDIFILETIKYALVYILT